ncbi:hypothetical protein [Fusobacterium necrophorum]|uniref:Uncharacterized protein n=1 Tax=Fusobacterium necrophorum DJ-2 TaxID=1441737 RepID=A0AB73C187_9FUSO|nr:hypothetical protein [Fusobacterium necrophorum]KDE64816.1 hypothetical protein FUSO4_07300 [Fusobacterium necrophorum DJ-1]KDE70279.1 hypothetical protein FUSO8_09525 [Fusobacterium necrophorum DJ-2]
MKQEIEIDICINLINWIRNYEITNEEILSLMKTNDYAKIAETLDKQRIDKEPEVSLTKIIENIEDVLKNDDKNEPVHMQRYSCGYLSIKGRLIQSCENLELTPEELIGYLSKAKDAMLQFHFIQFIIEKLLLQNDVKKSLELIPKIPEKDDHYSGYRLIADYYGKLGDKDNFLKILKKCDARKDVYEIEQIKETFIETYSSQNPLESTFELVNRKEFGSKYLIPAFLPIVKINSFDKIITHLNDPKFDVPKLYLKEIILANAFELNAANQTKENFGYLRNLLDKIPAKVRYKYSDFSLRDNLWSSVAECLIENNTQVFKSEINYCIKRINAKILKDDFKEWVSCKEKQEINP